MGALKHAVKKVVVVRWNERTFRVELEENATVGDLKRELQNLSNVKRTRIALAPVRPPATPTGQYKSGGAAATRYGHYKNRVRCRNEKGAV